MAEPAKYDGFEHARANAAVWLSSIEEMLEKLNAEQSEEARKEIQESVLSVSVRDGWRAPGEPNEDGADEYEILLTTGGPALRIWGGLSEYGQPIHAELQIQDWGTPWTRYPAPETTLLEFANHFWFGE